jgi:hypothetical protein
MGVVICDPCGGGKRWEGRGKLAAKAAHVVMFVGRRTLQAWLKHVSEKPAEAGSVSWRTERKGVLDVHFFRN